MRKIIKRKANSIHVKIVNWLLGKSLILKIREEAGHVKTVEIIDMNRRLTYGKWKVIQSEGIYSGTSFTISKEYSISHKILLSQILGSGRSL